MMITIRNFLDEKVNIKLHGLECALDVKKELLRIEGIPIEEQILFEKGLLVENSKIFNQDTELILVNLMKGGDQIFVKGFDGKTVAIDLPHKFDTKISEIKLLVEQKLGVNSKEIDLIYGGQELVDSATLIEMSIQNESTLHLVRRAPGGDQIFVKGFDGKTVAIDLHHKFDTKISEIKVLVEKKLGVSTKKIDLLYGGQVLEDSATLIEMSIQNESTLHIVSLAPGGDQIFVKGFDGKTVAIDLPSKFNTKISEIKVLVQAKLGVNAGDVELIYGGQELVDTATLIEMSIQNESTLHLVRKAKGGNQFFIQGLKNKIYTIDLPNQLDTKIIDLQHIISPKINLLGNKNFQINKGQEFDQNSSLIQLLIQNVSTLHIARNYEQSMN